jgi:DNA polymerase elongation subunit (family B)
MAYQNIYVERGEQDTVYVWDDTQGLITIPWSKFNYAYVRDPKGTHLTMTGERVSKTYRFNRNAPNIYESDFPQETRVLTDLYLNEDTPSRGNIALFFDIEVSMENGLPDVNTPNNEITSIALYDPLVGKYIVIVLDKNDLYTDRETDESIIYFCNNETNLLHKFINIYEQISPTIISGWNSDGFDVPYLYNRLRQVCGPSIANRLSPIGKVKYSQRKERYQIAGVSSLDYLSMYKKFTYTQQPNYRLDTIGRIEVDMGKVDYVGSLDDLFRDDLETFIEYNLQDVRIIVELDKKLKLIELVRGICHMGHVPYEEYSYSSKFLEGTIITYLHRKGIIVTNKPEGGRAKMDEMRDNNEQGFTGAFVKEPVPGRYEWVYSLDLQSLYPSIIMSLNISPDTKVGKVLNFDLDKHFKKEIVAYVIEEFGNNLSVELEYDKFIRFLEENNLSISSNGILYSNDKVGIIPDVLDTWFAQRKEYKDLMKQHTNEGDLEKADYYDRRQHIQKIFLNSLYGVLGLPVFRFYDVDNALAVTATGQDVIKNTAKVASLQYKKKIGVDGDFVTYIDTDSIYCSATPLMPDNLTFDQKKEFTIDLARGIEDTLNKFYDVFAKRAFNCDKHRLHIKGEAVASSAFWVAKKRYALDKVYDLETNQDVDKVAVKGLDVVRSSFPQAFRVFMKEILGDILKAIPKEEVDDKILTFKSSLKNRHFLDIARNTSANNISQYGKMDGITSMNQFKKGTPAHVKACLVYNRLLKYLNLDNLYAPISDGAKIKYVYLRQNPLKIDAVAVKGYQDPPEIISMIEEYIDTDALFENELRNKLDDFYSALAWGNIPTEVNQKADEFFSF